eukprot:597530-Pelagomonas_calceolata.AAC.9
MVKHTDKVAMLRKAHKKKSKHCMHMSKWGQVQQTARLILGHSKPGKMLLAARAVDRIRVS